MRVVTLYAPPKPLLPFSAPRQHQQLGFGPHDSRLCPVFLHAPEICPQAPATFCKVARVLSYTSPGESSASDWAVRALPSTLRDLSASHPPVARKLDFGSAAVELQAEVPRWSSGLQTGCSSMLSHGKNQSKLLAVRQLPFYGRTLR